jgi:hypothetical protein
VIAEAAARSPGPWIAHVSGATPLTALDPHVRRFGLHPLQSFSKARGPEQLDSAWGAVTAESSEARRVGFWLGETLGLRPFELDDANRAAYHAGPRRVQLPVASCRGGSLLEAAGRREALDPSSVVSRQRLRFTGRSRAAIGRPSSGTSVIRAERPELEEFYVVLAERPRRAQAPQAAGCSEDGRRSERRARSWAPRASWTRAPARGTRTDHGRVHEVTCRSLTLAERRTTRWS